MNGGEEGRGEKEGGTGCGVGHLGEGGEERGEVWGEERGRGGGERGKAAVQQEGEEVGGVAADGAEEAVKRLSDWRFHWTRNGCLSQRAAEREVFLESVTI